MIIIDTNVPKLAGAVISEIPEDQIGCTLCCVDFIRKLLDDPDACVVLDAGWQILKEYQKELEGSGHDPGLARQFLQWIYTHLSSSNNIDNTIILHLEKPYIFKEYPDHPDLKGFDKDDRKFIALANAHPKHPTIIEGSDHEWWGIKDALGEVGLSVRFLCEEYVEEKYKKKRG